MTMLLYSAPVRVSFTCVFSLLEFKISEIKDYSLFIFNFPVLSTILVYIVDKKKEREMFWKVTSQHDLILHS